MGKMRSAGKLFVILFVALTGVFIGGEGEWLVILPAAVIHELGHYFAARLCGVKIKRLRGDLLGMRMDMEGIISYRKECFIALCGPLSNFLTAGIVGGLNRAGMIPTSRPLMMFIYASLGLGGVNLIPVGTMDGGRLLTAAISGLISPTAAQVCVKVTTALCLGALWLLSGYALLRGAPVLAMFVFCFTLILRFAAPDGRKREI